MAQRYSKAPCELTSLSIPDWSVCYAVYMAGLSQDSQDAKARNK